MFLILNKAPWCETPHCCARGERAGTRSQPAAARPLPSPLPFPRAAGQGWPSRARYQHRHPPPGLERVPESPRRCRAGTPAAGTASTPPGGDSDRGHSEHLIRRGHGRHGRGAAPAARKRRCRAECLPLACSRHAVPPPRRGAGGHWLAAVPVGEGELRRCPRSRGARSAGWCGCGRSRDAPRLRERGAERRQPGRPRAASTAELLQHISLAEDWPLT
ncbi:beta-1,3-galactosyltransferase 1 isoform X2 [Taeniopygia guttata]|uniref:beta-1,3-galactosyltransferase 1 isoform X2 n=1 Tax=Taeniopygia guttata TaxID=59729 RepID=UPI003BB99BEE